VGLSAVGKSWLPRRTQAGTYDDAWLKDQWPLPPKDFDDAYWNCAPADQQLDHLPPGTEVLLVNLHPASEAKKQSTQDTWQGKLPRHQLWVGVVAKSGNDLIWNDRKMNLDTLVVNLAAQKITATYRFMVMDGASKNIQWQEMNTVLTSGPPDKPIKQEEWGLLR
jgi:hypothetical protein